MSIWDRIEPGGDGNAWDQLQRQEAYEKGAQVNRAARGLTDFEMGGNLNQDTLDAISKERGIYNRFLENANRQAALRGVGLKRGIQQQQEAFQRFMPDFANRQMQGVEGLQGQNQYTLQQLQNLQNGPTAAQQAGNEVNRRRFAMQVANQGQDRNIQARIARSGLGGSAGALFAAQNAAKQRANDLAGLEFSRSGLENEFMNQNLQRRQALLGQYTGGLGAANSIYSGTIGTNNALAQGIEMPQTDYGNWQKPKSFWQKAAGAIGGVLGTGVGALAGGVGAGFGGQVGSQLGNSLFGGASGTGSGLVFDPKNIKLGSGMFQ